MKICVAGKNNIAVDCLYYLLKLVDKSDICVLLNKSDDFKNSWQKSLGFFANLEGIEIKTIEEIQSIQDLIFISLEYDRIIKPERFKTDKLYNIHFSLLPEYKGMFTSLLPILHGKNYSGVTLHKIEKGIDTGDIISQLKFDISDLTCRGLYEEYMKNGFKLFQENIINLINSDFISQPQDSSYSTYFSKNAFDFNSLNINPNQTAYQINHFIKALNFRIYQMPLFNNRKIAKAVIKDKKSKEKPGTVIYEDTEKVIISTIDYDTELYFDYFDELMNCCRNNDLHKSIQIIDFVQNINETDINGWNPLIVACYYGSYDLVELLINNGADIYTKNYNGTNLLMYAKEAYLQNQDFKIIKLLIENGVNIYSQDVYGKNIFDYTDNISLLEYLNNISN